MKTFQVITDSTSDVEKKFREEYDLDYLKMVFTIEGKTYDADLDWNDISPKGYFDSMRRGNRSVTGAIKITELEQKFAGQFTLTIRPPQSSARWESPYKELV